LKSCASTRNDPAVALFVVTLVLTNEPAANVSGDAEAVDVKLGLVGGTGVGVGTTAADVTSKGTLTDTGVPIRVDATASATVRRCGPAVAFCGITTVAANAPRRLASAVGMPAVAPSQLKTIDANLGKFVPRTATRVPAGPDAGDRTALADCLASAVDCDSSVS